MPPEKHMQEMFVPRGEQLVPNPELVEQNRIKPGESLPAWNNSGAISPDEVAEIAQDYEPKGHWDR